MTASVFDSPMFTKRYPVGEAGRLFTHSAEIRAALLVLGTLAKVQGDRGDIPEDSAFFIHRSAMEVQIDPAGLAEGIAKDGSYIPALITAFAKAMEAPEHSAYLLHATDPQDVADTALMLRLRQLLSQAETALKNLPETPARAALLAEMPLLKSSSLHVAFAAVPDIGTAIGDALKLGAPQDPRAHVLAVANWIARAGDAALSGTPDALHHHVRGLNALLQESAGAPHVLESETLLLPQIALGSMSLLLRAAAA